MTDDLSQFKPETTDRLYWKDAKRIVTIEVGIVMMMLTIASMKVGIVMTEIAIVMMRTRIVMTEASIVMT